MVAVYEEIKGYLGEDSKIKKETMDVYRIPGVNSGGKFGRWAFRKFCDVYEMQVDFEEKLDAEFAKLVATTLTVSSLAH